MPRYVYVCEKCKKLFEKIMTILEREKGGVTCPICKGRKVTPQLASFVA
jgi:putative FmdB family regulatory protein